MTGALGGLLRITNIVGGFTLQLLIGKKAWDDAKIGRNYRLVFGSFSIGIILATITSIIFYNHDGISASFIGMPFLVGLITLISEIIRIELEK